MFTLSTSQVFWKIWGKKICRLSSRNRTASGRYSLQRIETGAAEDTVLCNSKGLMTLGNSRDNWIT